MAASAWTTAPARALDVLSDERLARIASRGDQRAFNALFARHRAGLTRYCRTVLRHAADAEDAAQNALVSAHRALQAGTVPMRVKPWLYKIAHNEAISLVRTRRPAEALDEATLPAVADAAEAGEIRRRLGQLMSDLRALTDRQREALVLRELCGLEYAEIAQTLGTSEAAAHQTVFEARSSLQQFGEGRALDCEVVQRAMSDCDGMRLRTRKVRAHVRGCECCRSFEASLLARRRDLGLLFPPTSAAGGVLAAVARLFGGGGGEPLLAGLGLKGAAVGLALLAGGGAVVATSVGGGEPNRPPAASAPVAPASATTTISTAPAAQGATIEAGSGRTGADRRKPARRRPGTPRPAAADAADDGTSSGAAGGTTLADAGTGGDATAGARADAGTGTRDTGGSSGTGSITNRGPSDVQDAVTAVGDTVQGTTDAVGGAVENTAGAVGETVGGATGAAEETVGEVTGDVLGDVTDTVGGLLGGN